jgi:hypothetical protein
MLASMYLLGTYSGTALTMLSSEISPLTAAKAAAIIKFTTGHPATIKPYFSAIDVASIAMYQSADVLVFIIYTAPGLAVLPYVRLF